MLTVVRVSIRETADDNVAVTIDLLSIFCKVYKKSLLSLNRTREDQPQSYIDECRVLPFRDSRLKAPTHFKTLISLGSSAP
jgi:hypothetical protein